VPVPNRACGELRAKLLCRKQGNNRKCTGAGLAARGRAIITEKKKNSGRSRETETAPNPQPQQSASHEVPFCHARPPRRPGVLRRRVGAQDRRPVRLLFSFVLLRLILYLRLRIRPFRSLFV
jgi:hypothetical protein